jgi:hypothetical protein
MRPNPWIARVSVFAALVLASIGGGWKWEFMP